MLRDRLVDKPAMMTLTLRAKSLTNRTSRRLPTLAISPVCLRRSVRRLPSVPNGTAPSPHPRPNRMLRIVSPPRSPQKCCATTRSCGESTRTTRSRCSSRKRPRSRSLLPRTEASTRAPSSRSPRRRASSRRATPATCPTCTRTRLFDPRAD